MTTKYAPLVKLATGGTAAVYIGANKDTRALVALKKLHAHLSSDKGFREALFTEAKISARLGHPHVVRVFEVESDEEDLTLVMEWVDGASLSDLIRSMMREKPQKQASIAIRIVLDACEGLHAAHELKSEDGAPLGIVHRDVSPQNVLVGVDGNAKLTDFGLAKPLYAAERTTSEGALRGKLGYMAPEYVKSGAVDRRADVFAMGVVAWEALAKKRLFRGDNDVSTIDRVREAKVPKLEEREELSRTAAAALDTVLSRALAKLPEERFPTARAFADALSDVARTHDLIATREEVASAFGGTLRTEIDARRDEVTKKRDELLPAPIETPKPKRAIAPFLAGFVVLAAISATAVFWRSHAHANAAKIEALPVVSTPLPSSIVILQAGATSSTASSSPSAATPIEPANISSSSPLSITSSLGAVRPPSGSHSAPATATAKHPRPNPYTK